MNRALFTTHCYLSWGLVTPYLMAMVHVTAALRMYIKGYSIEETTFTFGGENPTFPFRQVRSVVYRIPVGKVSMEDTV